MPCDIQPDEGYLRKYHAATGARQMLEWAESEDVAHCASGPPPKALALPRA